MSFGPLQLLPIKTTAGQIMADEQGEKQYDHHRTYRNPGNQLRCLPQQILPLQHLVHGDFQFLFLNVTEQQIDTVCQQTVVVTQITCPFLQLVDQLAPLFDHTVLQTSQHTHNRIGRIVRAHQRIHDHMFSRIDDDARVLFGRHKHLGQPLEESQSLAWNNHRILLYFDMLLDDYLIDNRIRNLNQTLNVGDVDPFRQALLPGFHQLLCVPPFLIQQLADRVDFQLLHGIGRQRTQRVQILLCLFERPVVMPHIGCLIQQLSDRFTLINQRERLVHQIGFLTRQGIRLFDQIGLLYQVINIRNREYSDEQQKQIAHQHFDSDIPIRSSHTLSN